MLATGTLTVAGLGDRGVMATMVLVPLAAVLLGAAAAVLAWQRQAALRAWATQIGWTYVGTDARLLTRWHRAPFGLGDHRSVSELMVGRFGRYPASSFRYRYTTGSGDRRTVHVLHVLTLELPTWLPSLELHPESVASRVAATFGASDDLELESADFNQRWRVEARTPRFAYDVLHPRTMERLVRDDARGLHLGIDGRDVLCWTPGEIDRDAVAARLSILRALADGIPRHVWLDHGVDPALIPERADPPA